MEELKKKSQEIYDKSKGDGPERLVTGSDDFTLYLWEPEKEKKPITRMTGHQQTVNQVTNIHMHWCHHETLCICFFPPSLASFSLNLWVHYVRVKITGYIVSIPLMTELIYQAHGKSTLCQTHNCWVHCVTPHDYWVHYVPGKSAICAIDYHNNGVAVLNQWSVGPWKYWICVFCSRCKQNKKTYQWWNEIQHLWFYIMSVFVLFQVVFSPDGRILASASFDKSVKLWCGKTGK